MLAAKLNPGRFSTNPQLSRVHARVVPVCSSAGRYKLPEEDHVASVRRNTG